MADTTPGRDRLRELLDAVLDEDNTTLAQMAQDAYASPYHFTRQLSRGAGEPPVTMRRRVMLERAAWQLRQGTSVTDAAWAAGYESVEGFSRAYSRAFGQPPSAVTAESGTHWLPAPNGIHFHPPTSLWVEEPGAQPGGEVTLLLVHHDLDDTRDLLEAAKGVPDTEWRAARLPGHAPLPFDGEEASLGAVLQHLVRTKEVWLASITGADEPPAGPDDPAGLLARHDAVAPRWLAALRDIERRGAWGDRLVDALCEPPESFVLGSVVAHVLTYSAHRRVLARWLLGSAAPGWPEGDPITWLRRSTGGLA
ncbi:helix-turn-helix domain-containing protein [Nocardioides sp. zg-DK7169]|uniref:helix-turn-helix domain-containing protein n=1 Tax=Nocardioides sp. zg-DK7169 TaxID=2736600 RepID=UPI0015535A00|nr:helix-turn-helix domain-containing protein [Nocardioides sp. zg-DK7169]NPC97426.1 helix-turn-helix domain-containing protein [Nocardioides sp. zg-DK7169]